MSKRDSKAHTLLPKLVAAECRCTGAPEISLGWNQLLWLDAVHEPYTFRVSTPTSILGLSYCVPWRLIFTSEAAGRLVLRLLCVFHVCWYICVSALITCAIIMSRSLHCCHATLLSRLRQFRRLLCVATTNSLAQL